MTDTANNQQPATQAEKVEIVARERLLAVPTTSASIQPPRLGIVHLLLWTACCAAFLRAAHSLAQHPAGIVGAASLVIVAIGSGAAWAGLAITLTRVARGRAWPIEPGQWLLAVLGAIVAAEVLVVFGHAYGLRNQRGVVLAVSACVFVLPALSRRLEPRWKWLFAAASVAFALPLFISVLAAQIDVPMVVLRGASRLSSKNVSAGVAAAAVVLSAVQAPQNGRGWLHWVGVGTAIWLAASSFIV